MHISYSYNEDGLRVGKRVSWSSLGVERNTEYYYNGSALIGMKTGDTVQRFSYDAQGKVVSVDYSENGGSTYTTYYYSRNAQGDIVKLIDSNKNTVVEYTYDSWGKVLTTTGSLATTLGENQPFRYRGYVYDNDTNLYYLQSRYYNPAIGRFISSDVYLSTGQGVLGHNSYAYCLNNPVNMVDTDGLKPVFTVEYSDQTYRSEGYSTLKEALLVAGITLNILTNERSVEHARVIYKVDARYYLSPIIVGEHSCVGLPKSYCESSTAIATIHSHTYCLGHQYSMFSDEDMDTADDLGLDDYLALPTGKMLKYKCAYTNLEKKMKILRPYRIETVNGINLPKATNLVNCHTGGGRYTNPHFVDMIN